MLVDLLARLRAERPLPVADAALLAAPARRTRAIRLVLGASLVAAAILAVLAAPRNPGRRYLPANAVGIVVLDVSSSVKPSTYYRIEQTLAEIAASKGRLGLVLFSDVAYEAFPTGTPAAALKPVLRFFAPPAGTTPEDQYVAGSPWQQWFSAGTRISTGLDLADQMLETEHAKRGAILLISDLADDPNDYETLKDSVLRLEQKEVPLMLVALDPTQRNANFFKRLLGERAIYETAKLPTGAQARGRITVENGFSTPLALAAAVVVLLLALNEWWAEPFRFRRRVA